MAATLGSDIYRDLMRFKPSGMTPNAWAISAGVSRTVWADMRRHGNPSRRTLEKLLAAAGSSLAEFEALRVSVDPAGSLEWASSKLSDARRSWTAAAADPLPLIASTLAGEWGQPGSGIEQTAIEPATILERLPRPPSIAADGDAYALTIVGDSMSPRFNPGWRIAVTPRFPAAIGDDVLVRLNSTSAIEGGRIPVLIKRLVAMRANEIELRQFSPELTFSLDLRDVAAVHRIAGQLI